MRLAGFLLLSLLGASAMAADRLIDRSFTTRS